MLVKLSKDGVELNMITYEINVIMYDKISIVTF